MKGLVVLFVLGLAAAGGVVYFPAQNSGDPGRMFLLAFGQPKHGKIEINICLPIAIRRTERVIVVGDLRSLQWDDWVDEHFVLTDSNGDMVELQFKSHSQLVSDTQAGGAPDGWVSGFTKEGETYTLDYIRDLVEDNHFRYSFTASADLKPRKRVTFEAVE